jgi:Beta propeller domain
VLTLAMLQACGGGANDAAAPAEAPPQALAVSKPGELTTTLQNTLRKRVASGTATGTGTGVEGGALFSTPVLGSVADPASDTGLRSATLLQEAGVDEANLLIARREQLYTLKSEGTTMLLAGYTRDAAGVARAAQQVSLRDAAAGQTQADGLLFNEEGTALAVVARSWVRGQADSAACLARFCAALSFTPVLNSLTSVQRVALNEQGGLAPGEHLSIDGQLVDSRRIGNRLYLVSSFRPSTVVEQLPPTTTAAEREEAIAALTAAQMLPKIRRNGGAAQPLLAETDCYVQPLNASVVIEITTVTVIDLSVATLPTQSRCIVGGAEALYMSANALYLATTRYVANTSDARGWVFAPNTQTDLHKFALQGGTVAYKGSGVVPGHLGWDPQRKSLRLSEHNGDLRVLTFTGQQGWGATTTDVNGAPVVQVLAPSPAQLTVLREDSAAQGLVAVGALPNTQRPAALGKPGEQVFGVRFVGERAYVVTFRRTDPLYVLDLSNPVDPRTAGQLELAGFSESLFPLPGNLLLGLGRSADANGRVLGLQVALFDVANASAPRLVVAERLGGAASTSALDFSRHGLNLLQAGATTRLALPVTLLDSFGQNGQQGLQRFEVDTVQRTLTMRPLLGARAVNEFGNNAQERSLQIGNQLYYANPNGLDTFTW